MSPDEVLVFIVCLVITVIAWAKWYFEAAAVAPLASSRSDRSNLLLTPAIAALILFSILKRFASHDVREDPVYLSFYMAMGAAWVGLARGGLSWLGLNARDDVIERNNRAASSAVCGGLLGMTLCFSGGNIGDGPGWWVVVFAAALATGTLLSLWIILHVFTSIADTVTIERDPAAGLRVAGFFVGGGLILGRAVAGDWVSVDATVMDFLKAGWPVLLLLGAAIPLERRMQPMMDRPFSQTMIMGWMPALFYIAFGIAVLLFPGPWA